MSYKDLCSTTQDFVIYYFFSIKFRSQVSKGWRWHVFNPLSPLFFPSNYQLKAPWDRESSPLKDRDFQRPWGSHLKELAFRMICCDQCRGGSSSHIHPPSHPEIPRCEIALCGATLWLAIGFLGFLTHTSLGINLFSTNLSLPFVSTSFPIRLRNHNSGRLGGSVS